MAKKTAAGRTARTAARGAVRDRTGRGLPPIEEAVQGDLAAPGRVHQPVKESGLGTPSADARPGRASMDVLDELADPADLNRRVQERQKNRIKVQATRTGYYDDVRRRAGEVFHISGETLEEDQVNPDTKKVVRKKGEIAAFSERWMRRVAEKTPLTGTKGPNQVIRERHDEILGARNSGSRQLEDNPLDAD